MVQILKLKCIIVTVLCLFSAYIQIPVLTYRENSTSKLWISRPVNQENISCWFLPCDL